MPAFKRRDHFDRNCVKELGNRVLKPPQVFLASFAGTEFLSLLALPLSAYTAIPLYWSRALGISVSYHFLSASERAYVL